MNGQNYMKKKEKQDLVKKKRIKNHQVINELRIKNEKNEL